MVAGQIGVNGPTVVSVVMEEFKLVIDSVVTQHQLMEDVSVQRNRLKLWFVQLKHSLVIG